MKISYKNLIFIAIIFSVIMLFSVIIKQNNFSTREDISTMNDSAGNRSVYISDPNFIVGNPFMNITSFRYETGGAKFVLYEDFPIHMPSYFNKEGLRMENLPVNTWAKFIQTNSSHYDEVTLRLMGAIEPLMPNPFNETLSLFEKPNNMIVKTSLPIVKNGIMEEISVIRDSIPVKFKHEILVHNNSKMFYIFGVVYDPTFVNNRSVINEQMFVKSNASELNVNIEPIGLMSDGKLINFPTWLQLKTLKLPLTLKENEPDYYILGISTNSAPVGSYQVAMRETINQKIFIETITLTIIPS